MHFQPRHICFESCTFTLTRVRLLNTLYGSKAGHLSQGSTLPCRLSHRWLDEAQLSWGHTPDRWSSINHRWAACKLFPSGSLSTRSAACQRVTGPRLPPPPQKSSFIPTASGTFQFVTVWCLWARTYCWDSLFPRRRKHRLWNHITWARRLWKWLQMLRLDYHVWVSATYSHFSETAREFCCKRRAAALPRYRSAQICSFAKDI